MAILYNKTNAFYLIACSLAVLTLLSSVPLVVYSSVPFLLILTVAILSALVIRFSYKIINDRAELTNLAKEIQGLKSIMQGKEIELDDRRQRVKELGGKIKYQETELDTAKKEIQDQEADAEKKMQELKILEDITEHQRAELDTKEEKIQALKSVINKYKIEIENYQKQSAARGRSSSLPSFSLTRSMKASSSTNLLPQ